MAPFRNEERRLRQEARERARTEREHARAAAAAKGVEVQSSDEYDETESEEEQEEEEEEWGGEFAEEEEEEEEGGAAVASGARAADFRLFLTCDRLVHRGSVVLVGRQYEVRAAAQVSYPSTPHDCSTTRLFFLCVWVCPLLPPCAHKKRCAACGAGGAAGA